MRKCVACEGPVYSGRPDASFCRYCGPTAKARMYRLMRTGLTKEEALQIISQPG